MENDNRDRELIQRFIEGNLTEAEEAEVNYRMKEEKSFQQMYAEYEQLALGIRYAHLNQKLEQLRTLEAGLPPIEGRVIQFRQYWLPVAAAAALVISLGIWLMLTADTAPLNENLYAQYFEPFDSPGSGLTRSTTDAKTTRAKAYMAYDSENYKDASTLFVAALKEKDDPIMLLCLGNTWLALDKPTKAEEVFNHILEGHGDLITQAKWYLALTYLRQGKIERTKATLWEISNSSTYGKQARELLKKLD